MRAAGLMPLALVLSVLVPVAGCGGEEGAGVPPPREPRRADVDYYSGMVVLERPGPKAQIFLSGRDDPLWFASVRDAVAFTMLPEEPKDIAAIYVQDMAVLSGAAAPRPGAWIDARAAWYVIAGPGAGAGGAPEAVPFSRREAARRFADERGGRVVAFDEIPRAAVLTGAGAASPAEGAVGPPETGERP